MTMDPHELIARAEHSADRCDAYGFCGTAQSLRALAEAIQDSTRLLEKRYDARAQHLQLLQLMQPQTHPQD